MEKEEMGQDANVKKWEKEQQKSLERAFIGGVICQHCYCGKGNWNDKEHIVCCICGHRTLENPISY